MKRLIGILLLLLSVCAVNAQTLTSYSCDFEDAAENAQWQCNVGPRASFCKNHWYIGAAGSFGPGSTRGMYIGTGTGADTLKNEYSNTLQWEFITSYRQLNLADGTYTLVFDWQAFGNDNDALYVAWVDGATTQIISNYNVRANINPPAYCVASNKFNAAASWQSTSMTFTVSGGQGGKLVLLWYNPKGTGPKNPPAAVDNISIFQGTCAAPTNVAYNPNTRAVTWSGNAGTYDVMVYNSYTKTTDYYPSIQGNSLSLAALSEEGMFYFYVRSVCDAVRHSEWTFTSIFVWIKGARCIDYMDLGTNSSYAGMCYTGEFDDFIRYNRQGTPGKVDNGPADPNSMHTLHIDRGEYDPNATVAGGLRTVPAGEIASVRLGAYTSSGLSARVEYKYHVQAGMSDLLDLKYAVLLKSGGHGSSLSDSDMNPTFTLNILDGSGREVDGCSQRYFVAGYGGTGKWHQENDLYWCDWDQVTVSLRQYIGQTLTIRLTSTRCSFDTHYAYAYFTIGCRGGDLQGIACGDFSTDHFEAPEGFNYRWYRADDPTRQVRGTNRIFNIDRDDPNIYLVDMIDQNNPQCYYVLEANPNPRFPQARAEVTRTRSANCQNIVDFSQTSCVVRINRQTLDSIETTDPIESVVWDFGDGSEPVESLDAVMSHAFPAEGGEFDVQISASMSSGVCVDTKTIHVSLPSLITPDTHDSVHICGEGIDRVDSVATVNEHGCTVYAIHHTFYHPIFDTLYSEHMCEGGRYLFPGDGKYYTSSIDTTLKLKSQYDCDSLIRLNLVVDPKLIVEYPSNVGVCLEENYFELPYEVTSGMMDSIKVYFSERDQELGFDSCYGFAYGENIRIALPDNLYPNNYQLKVEFGGDRCRMDIQYVTMQAKYKPSIVMQNDGFIALQNKDYNGGYDFVQYEWFKDGILVESEAAYVPTEPYDVGSTFVIRLRRRDESYFVESCPIEYNPRTALEDVLAGGGLVNPTYVRRGENMTVAAGEGFAVYTILGTCVARYDASSQQRVIPAPVHTGMYLVVFDNREAVQIVVH